MYFVFGSFGNEYAYYFPHSPIEGICTYYIKRFQSLWVIIVKYGHKFFHTLF